MNAPAALGQLLPLEAYTSDEWFRAEQAKLFGKAWVFAGMAEDLRAPGDYQCVDSGASSLILLRDRQGELRAFHNVCRHRGARLLEGRGNVGSAITCFYHNWTYELSGALTGVTLGRDQFPGIDKSCYGLRRAQVGRWKNLVFVNPDPAAESFDDWLAGVPEARTLNEPGQLALHDPERLVEVSSVRYRVHANWKIVVENFIDGYHLPLLHKVSLGDGDFMRQKWAPRGRHVTFYRPLKPGISYNDQPLPVIEGIPPTYGLAYYWLFPSVAITETATFWTTFHVIPLSARDSIVHSRLRAMPEALARKGSRQVAVNQALPRHVISAEGPYAEMRLDLSETHPLQSNNVMAEDIYACEAVQRGMDSGSCEIGPLSKWESTLTFFQKHVLDYMGA
ncbi:MAG TPA: aromatic ring-hydroxylating dioxygenase subunit alpha [Alphaproteobacteria bacterium]|nr:aromatic ring-hydroxylating dioxygenase subunit alpha [Alphaproteobacteria bacterium]